MVFRNNRMLTAYNSGDESNEYPCDVSIAGGTIEVSYEDERCPGKRAIYTGRETSEGHFELDCPHLSGLATLHQFPGGKIRVCELSHSTGRHQQSAQTVE